MIAQVMTTVKMTAKDDDDLQATAQTASDLELITGPIGKMNRLINKRC